MTSGFPNVCKQPFPQNGYASWYNFSVTQNELVRAGQDPISFIPAGSPPWNQPRHKSFTSLRNVANQPQRVAPAYAQKGSCMHVNTGHNPYTPAWYLLKEDSCLFHPLLSFSFPSQPGFKRLRCYDKTNLPTKLEDLKGQTQGESILYVSSILAACPASLF